MWQKCYKKPETQIIYHYNWRLNKMRTTKTTKSVIRCFFHAVRKTKKRKTYAILPADSYQFEDLPYLKKKRRIQHMDNCASCKWINGRTHGVAFPAPLCLFFFSCNCCCCSCCFVLQGIFSGFKLNLCALLHWFDCRFTQSFFSAEHTFFCFAYSHKHTLHNKSSSHTISPLARPSEELVTKYNLVQWICVFDEARCVETGKNELHCVSPHYWKILVVGIFTRDTHNATTWVPVIYMRLMLKWH